jgi:hypothetical protein
VDHFEFLREHAARESQYNSSNGLFNECLSKFGHDFFVWGYQLFLSLLLPMIFSVAFAYKKAGGHGFYMFSYLDLFKNKELIYLFVTISAITLHSLKPEKLRYGMQFAFIPAIIAGAAIHIVLITDFLGINFESSELVFGIFLAFLALNLGSLLICAFRWERKK